jgi:hypothetical protein
VIGAGQAGLVIGYFLKRPRRNFVILDAAGGLAGRRATCQAGPTDGESLSRSISFHRASLDNLSLLAGTPTRFSTSGCDIPAVTNAVLRRRRQDEAQSRVSSEI